MDMAPGGEQRDAQGRAVRFLFGEEPDLIPEVMDIVTKQSYDGCGAYHYRRGNKIFASCLGKTGGK